MNGFTGRSVLITGASSALGLNIASRFIEEGAICHLHGFNNMQGLKEIQMMAADKGVMVHLIQADLRDGQAASRCIQAVIDISGHIDVLVTCMGQAFDSSLFLYEESHIEESLAANLLTVMNVCAAALPDMCRRGQGRIVGVSSITGKVGQPMRAIYAASKGAVNGYFKALGRHFASRGISVNALLPQVVNAGMGDAMKNKMRALLLANTPIRRPCTESEVSNAVLFLASDAASYMAGEGLAMTGGLITW
jgi:3-oxoacyl-[acyl-carrier protein] reductase